MQGASLPMKIDFHPASDAACYVLFDPAAVPQLIQGSFGPFRDVGHFYSAIGEEATRGNIWIYYDDGDGDPRVRVYVDEQPEDRLDALATQRLEGSLLRAPSGRILCMGGEWIEPCDQEHLRPETYAPKKGYLGSEALIPPGVYRLSGFETDWKRGNVEGKIRNEMGSGLSEAYHRTQDRTGCGCLATVGAVLLALAVGGACYVDNRWQPFYAALAALLPLIAGMWAWIIRGWSSAEVKQAFKRYEESEKEWPSIVLVLTQVSEEEVGESFRPAKMGPSAAYQSA